MNHTTPRQLNKEIRALTAKLGWDVWHTFTDSRKNGKRVTFMRNFYGYVPSNSLRDIILVDVKKLLKKRGLQRSHKVRWCKSVTGYKYYYLAMHVTAS